METKYKVGDKVWFINNNEVQSEEITGVMLRKSVFSENYFVYEFTHEYTLPQIPTPMVKYNHFTIDESRLFASKEDLLASI